MLTITESMELIKVFCTEDFTGRIGRVIPDNGKQYRVYDVPDDACDLVMCIDGCFQAEREVSYGS